MVDGGTLALEVRGQLRKTVIGHSTRKHGGTGVDALESQGADIPRHLLDRREGPSRLRGGHILATRSDQKNHLIRPKRIRKDLQKLSAQIGERATKAVVVRRRQDRPETRLHVTSTILS